MFVFVLAVFKSLQMELTEKFQEGTSCNTIKINMMEVDRKYPVIKAERIVTKFGPTILLSIRLIF